MNRFYWFYLIVFLLNSCVKQNSFDRKIASGEYLLYFNDNSDSVKGSFDVLSQSENILSFQPFKDFGINEKLLYIHQYNGNCIYHPTDTSEWNFADVGFPHPCLTGKPMFAQVNYVNKSESQETVYFRLFYQNSSYSYLISDFHPKEKYIQNDYGGSDIVMINIPPKTDTLILIPWRIKTNPRGYNSKESSIYAPRPGYYEFCIFHTKNSKDSILNTNFNLSNPFFEIVSSQDKRFGYSATLPSHFKFIFLEERFTKNDLTKHRYYIPQHYKTKPLCDTCDGHFVNYVSEKWDYKDFYSGKLQKYGYIKADYGNREECVVLNEKGIELNIPAKNKKGKLSKTWGEVIFGQPFKYGHVTIRAKLAQMMNTTSTPNGIIHNIWLFQRGSEDPDSTNPFKYLRNYNGVHRYEIDYEIWSSAGEKYQWDDSFLIDYSIVDYMRDPNVNIKPNEEKKIGKYTADRHNGKQCNIYSPQFPRSFFDKFHDFEIIWKPESVQFKIDGKEVAFLSPEMAKIPDKEMYLWLGSPIYQDGTFYTQSAIPFLEMSKKTTISFIRIE